MVIEKILNNNVVVVVDQDGHEKIVMGRGIAFHKKVHDYFDDTLVEKTFYLQSKDVSTKFQQLIHDVPMEYIKLADEIVKYAKMHSSKRLSEILIISLCDHIFSSITRFQQGIQLKNPLLYDIKRFYKEEYTIALACLKIIAEKTNIDLPEDEAGFLTLHFVNAQMEEGNIQEMYTITKIMQEILNVVKYVYHMEFDEEDVYYYRFITHLKFFALRLVTHKPYPSEQDDELFKMIQRKYQNAYQCVLKIQTLLEKEYHYTLSQEEKMYLTIHVERITNQKKGVDGV